MGPIVFVATFIPCICGLIISNMAIHMTDISSEASFLWKDNRTTRKVRDLNCLMSVVVMITVMSIRLSSTSPSGDDLLDNMMCQILAMCMLIVAFYTIAVRYLHFEIYRQSQKTSKKGELLVEDDPEEGDNSQTESRWEIYRNVAYQFVPPYIICAGILVYVRVMRLNIRCESCEVKAMFESIEQSRFNVTFQLPGNNSTILELTEEWKDLIIYNDPLTRGFVLAVHSLEVVVYGMLSSFLVYMASMAITSLRGATIHFNDWIIQVLCLFTVSTSAFVYRGTLVDSYDTMPDHFVAGVIAAITSIMAVFDYISVSCGRKPPKSKYTRLSTVSKKKERPPEEEKQLAQSINV